MVTLPVALSPTTTTTVPLPWSTTLIPLSTLITSKVVLALLGSYFLDPSNITSTACEPAVKLGSTNVPTPPDTNTVWFSPSTLTVTFPYKSLGVSTWIMAFSPTVMFSAVTFTVEDTLDTLKLVVLLPGV